MAAFGPCSLANSAARRRQEEQTAYLRKLERRLALEARKRKRRRRSFALALRLAAVRELGRRPEPAPLEERAGVAAAGRVQVALDSRVSGSCGRTYGFMVNPPSAPPIDLRWALTPGAIYGEPRNARGGRERGGVGVRGAGVGVRLRLASRSASPRGLSAP